MQEKKKDNLLYGTPYTITQFFYHRQRLISYKALKAIPTSVSQKEQINSLLKAIPFSLYTLIRNGGSAKHFLTFFFVLSSLLYSDFGNFGICKLGINLVLCQKRKIQNFIYFVKMISKSKFARACGGRLPLNRKRKRPFATSNKQSYSRQVFTLFVTKYRWIKSLAQPPNVISATN